MFSLKLLIKTSKFGIQEHPPNNSNDLCLLFCPYPAFMVDFLAYIYLISALCSCLHVLYDRSVNRDKPLYCLPPLPDKRSLVTFLFTFYYFIFIKVRVEGWSKLSKALGKVKKQH